MNNTLFQDSGEPMYKSHRNDKYITYSLHVDDIQEYNLCYARIPINPLITICLFANVFHM